MNTNFKQSSAYELAEHAEGLAYEIPADWSSGEPKNVATDIANMLRQQADRIAKLEKHNEALADEYAIQVNEVCRLSYEIEKLELQTKPLSDEEWNKAFDFYCETDEGVLKFDLELRDEWKREQLIRWKEALRKAQEK